MSVHDDGADMSVERFAIGALTVGLAVGVLGALARLGLTVAGDGRVLATTLLVVGVVTLLGLAGGVGADDDDTTYW